MEIKRKLSLALLLLLFLIPALAAPALAQAGLTLRVDKDFGYNSGRNIRGTFTLGASGPQDLALVVFYLDGQEIGRVSQAPFEMTINTDSYPSGDHLLRARAELASGAQVESAERNFRFLLREEEAAGMRNILVPLLGVIALLTVGGMAIQMFVARGSQNRPGLGSGQFAWRSGWGAMCPRCQLPTPVHITGLNLGFLTKFDRCENCGKWSLMRVRPERELEVYARALAAANRPQVQVENEEEKLRRQVDDSRYTD